MMLSRRAGRALLLTCLVTGPTICAGAPLGGGPKAGTLMWKFAGLGAAPAPKITPNVTFNSPLLSRDQTTLYVTGNDRNLYAINTANGRLRWNISLTYLLCDLILSKDEKTIYVGGAGDMYAVKSANGQIKWSTAISFSDEVPSAVTTRAVETEDGKVIIFGTAAYALYAVHANNGKVKWTSSTGGEVWGAPVLDKSEKAVFFGSGWNRVHKTGNGLFAVNAENGERLWRFSGFDPVTPGGAPQMWSVEGGPIISDDGKTVYAGATDGKVHAFTAKTGVELWNANAGSKNVETEPTLGRNPQAKQRALYYGSNGGKIYAVDAADGSGLWTFKTKDEVWSSPTLSSDGKTVYCGSDDGSLYAIDWNGNSLWTFKTGNWVRSKPVVSANDQVVYFGSRDNYLYAVYTGVTPTLEAQ